MPTTAGFVVDEDSVFFLHVRRNGDRTARAGVENVINRRASAPCRRSAGEGVRSLKLQGNTRARADRTTSFLLAPPSLWPGVSAGGWCVKVMKSTTKPDVTTVKFNDSTVTFSFAVVASWKPVS
ncbi:hypothetical protein EMIHUDRAFT_219242 [Emiliania huxleyi CCMP1516]|uniref:Uncharacterized protein n=2 Tax=Emiliania huxleyi TaxID=2903 RepID=A0A0D3I535_EMIH1|nr:hypothetical protein EMIHUDRAFT_219242 [Emiliania huxleyi CCMP1516]EOD06370.1 hypothetical protein EMIHUDRAFT_219242 [Emiliania huxleyi CCMP1516]|eukprot:XP_005758799.1 hypothetical protein EMIHUDRAFT_219242 [Emiliania huxleyi CCMP1516]